MLVDVLAIFHEDKPPCGFNSLADWAATAGDPGNSGFEHILACRIHALHVIKNALVRDAAQIKLRHVVRAIPTFPLLFRRSFLLLSFFCV